MRGNAIIAQGGGPTAVINQTLVGAILEAQKSQDIERLYGAIHGVEGIVNEEMIDLTQVSSVALDEIATTTASALLSTRVKPDSAYCQKIFAVLQAHNIRFFYYIGGNDSADTCRILSETARNVGYDLKVVHIPKTIDNDLRETDHCPGFGSAAKFVASAFSGVNNDNRALPGVYIGVVMGRDAGFLTASSALARRYRDDAPHLIYLPEIPFDREKFCAQVQAVYDKLGRCVVAVSEGIRGEDGQPVLATLLSEVECDDHGNMQLSGNGALADSLVRLVKDNCSVSKVRGDTFGYLQRSFSGLVSETDAKEARAVGEMGVRYSQREAFTSGSVVIRRKGAYAVGYDCVDLSLVARRTKSMPSKFIDAESADVTDAFIKYCAPLAGEIDRGYRLESVPVRKLVSR